jgi:hypothetical protein
LTIRAWAIELGITESQFRRRVGRGWTGKKLFFRGKLPTGTFTKETGRLAGLKSAAKREREKYIQRFHPHL